MAIIKWDPLGNIATLQDRINQLFDDSFPHQHQDDETVPLCAWTPSVDIYETEQGVVIAADLPGVNKEDVSVEVKENVLTIRGERKPDQVQRIPAKHFRDAKHLQPGRMVSIQTRRGPVQATVIKVGRFNVDVDTNHPLAGQTLTFDVEVTDVRDASAEEISHGHVHGAGGVNH